MSEGSTQPRYKRLKRIFLAAVIIACGAVIYWRETRRETPPSRYPDYSAMLPFYPLSAGLRMPTGEELRKLGDLWPTVPPEQNGAMDYMRAVSLLTGTPPPGSPHVATPYAGDQKAMEAWVNGNRPALDAVREALKKQYLRFPLFYKINPTPTPVDGMEHLSGLRNLSRLCADAGFTAELQGKPDEAAEWYLTSVRMGAHIQTGPMIQGLVRMALCAIGQKQLDQLIANSTLADGTLRKIIADCRAAEGTPGLLTNLLEDERRWMDSVMPRVTGQWVAEMVAGNPRAQIDTAIAETKNPLHDVLRRERTGEFKRGWRSGATDLGYLRLLEQSGRCDLTLRATQVRAAIALYQKQNNRLPDDLAALCPTILPQVPLDPFSGKTLRYKRTDDGWMLWSVGEDLKDDNGDDSAAQQFKAAWRGPDWVARSKLPTTLEVRRTPPKSGQMLPKQAAEKE